MKDEQLIEAVRHRTFLYDLQHPKYKDVKLKNIAWKQVAEELGLPVDRCRKRWQNIRHCYRKHRARNNATLSGQATSSERPFKFGNTLDFLDPSLEERAMLSSVGESFMEEASGTSEEATSASLDTASGILSEDEENDCKPPPKRRRTEAEDDLLCAINRCASLIKRSISGSYGNTSQALQSKAKLVMFFKAMALDVCELSRRRQRIIKMTFLQKISEMQEEEEKEREQREQDLHDARRQID